MISSTNRTRVGSVLSVALFLAMNTPLKQVRGQDLKDPPQSAPTSAISSDASARRNDVAPADHFKGAEAHLGLGRKHLQEARGHSSTDELAAALTEFDQAAHEYRIYATQPVAPEERLHQLWWAVGGLLESNHPLEALELILQHPEASKDPTVLHLKADTLMALGDRQGAAETYETWIAVGHCDSYYRLWYGEVSLRGERFPYLVSPSAPKDPCAFLPQELRARLETLHRLYAHPNNLPPKNYPFSPQE